MSITLVGPFPVLAEAFDLLVAAAAAVPAGALDGPTPCADWTVAQVLLHAAADQEVWAASVGRAAMPAFNPFAPPARPAAGSVDDAVRGAVAAASGAWADVAPVGRVATPLPPFPELDVEVAAGVCALDAAVHAWDVAVATGQVPGLTDGLAERLLAAARVTAEPLRGFAYGAALPAVPGETAVGALLRFLGRDPAWSV
ncbi:maleylpyruvate isomerase family mycothiol-dependent enzyme [Pseudofrankia asymbiotica]|uniref:Mycothiol-dependent maleylpyruvate isomerase metal-binding domain-containing protein n=1 Tax=Pseudofrankia asymbiotica TaxID=1834516 RepID=A0A1V2IK88_9ACTN|nr:maleylpyruvate isomerase family mycothiol-dependent enzyme [Pseudofrankia asymbiotica]ONH32876.1 hypothetical protein BL253_03990 [Pseudofrankia asymbiotica]